MKEMSSAKPQSEVEKGEMMTNLLINLVDLVLRSILERHVAWARERSKHSVTGGRGNSFECFLANWMIMAMLGGEESAVMMQDGAVWLVWVKRSEVTAEAGVW